MPSFRQAAKREFASKSRWLAFPLKKRPSVQDSTSNPNVQLPMEINPQLVKQLRDKTNAGMMDCKRALAESGGDLGKAETILRTKGITSASKKASRATREGIVASYIHLQGKVGV